MICYFFIKSPNYSRLVTAKFSAQRYSPLEGIWNGMTHKRNVLTMIHVSDIDILLFAKSESIFSSDDDVFSLRYE
jgi:hypothetical protein